MRIAMAGLCLIAWSPMALAQQRPETYAMTCQAAQNLVKARGAVVLSMSRTAYDRYVRDQGQCYAEQSATPSFEQTRDNAACLIGYRCIEPTPDNF